MLPLLVAAGMGLVLQPNARPPGVLQPDGRCEAVARNVRTDQEQYFQRLGRLPPAGLEYAVMRTVQGCMVPAPMGYHPPAPPQTPKAEG